LTTCSRADAGAWFNYTFLTQKERDNETGLDYSIHRYYSSAQGRFTSPDPLLSSGRPVVPDSWNRYTYVLNNPLALVDPDGLDWGVSEWDDKKGHHHINYHWFSGKIGAYDGHSYSAVNFGSAGSLDVPTDNGQIVRIANRGLLRQVIYKGLEVMDRLLDRRAHSTQVLDWLMAPFPSGGKLEKPCSGRWALIQARPSMKTPH
jgi:RHS repeat-associated protein